MVTFTRTALPALALLALTLSACPRPKIPPPPPPPAPPPISVPPGCETNLEGEYAHAEHGDWRYVGADDGGTLVLKVRRDFPDAGVGSTEIVLTRSPRGFRGSVDTVAFPAPGVECPVSFPTEVTACDDAGLELTSIEALAIDQSCQQPAGDAGWIITTHRLERIAPGSTPGTPDAG